MYMHTAYVYVCALHASTQNNLHVITELTVGNSPVALRNRKSTIMSRNRSSRLWGPSEWSGSRVAAWDSVCGGSWGGGNGDWELNTLKFMYSLT